AAECHDGSMLVPLLRIWLGQHRALGSCGELVQTSSSTGFEACFQEFAMIARIDRHSPDCLLSFLQLALSQKPVDGYKPGILGTRVQALIVRHPLRRSPFHVDPGAGATQIFAGVV